MARSPFFGGGNAVGQDPWALRGADDARIRALETRLAAIEGQTTRYFSLVGKLADQGVTSAVTHTVDFDTVVDEDVAFFNNTTNTWTLPASGLWQLKLHITYISDVNTATDSTAIWNIDGNLYEGTRSVRPVNSGTGVFSDYTAPLNAGQVVTPQGFITATNPVLYGDGGSGNSLRYTRASVRRLGPL